MSTHEDTSMGSAGRSTAERVIDIVDRRTRPDDPLVAKSAVCITATRARCRDDTPASTAVAIAVQRGEIVAFDSVPERHGAQLGMPTPAAIRRGLGDPTPDDVRALCADAVDVLETPAPVVAAANQLLAELDDAD